MMPENPPAYPSFIADRVYANNADHVGHIEHVPVGGMSLRDYFAGQALASVIEVYRFDNGGGIGVDHLPRNVAAHAYRIADAMLAERSK